VQRSHERVFVILTECPVCGYEFDPERFRSAVVRWQHPEGSTSMRAWKLLR